MGEICSRDRPKSQFARNTYLQLDYIQLEALIWELFFQFSFQFFFFFYGREKINSKREGEV